MSAEMLSVALEREHREIDSAIEGFVAHLDRGELRAELFLAAVRALRRHIYLEETFLFPPIREAGMVMPVMVMLHEHGQLWRTMDSLTDLLDRPASSAQLMTGCGELLAQLARHNSKEEPVLYPHADCELSPQAHAELARFIRTGQTPDGWTCQRAAAG